ncbi:TonB-dependent receptor [Biformimicrobium ophioploci]|uniref:TonB-dependent receptor n=1 Tax=Biformimicrobium ophioploci TaxID=3036711 RepID=A0ABQ6LWN6_9GAMM|nr:TonB-dependent receptor [Microbulbifer sp. NKW57]GMG86529.1 TonB-dependent receptor [Microbulbifer sp. NKW57]
MLKRNKLALSVQAAVLVAGGLLATQAIAQEAIEEVSVTGIRGSLLDALNTKRDANAVVDAISAEDVGKFPDKNVAESLSRITGVAVSREFGEGEKITIRGQGPDLNRTLLNGQTVATADWFILDNPARSFNYTLLPSTLISGLEVYKSPMASIDEGSIGGTVVVKTHRPLDLDAHAVNVAVESQYSEKSGENDPLLSGQYSWKNDDSTFGVLVSVADQKRSVQREGLEVLGWRGADDGYLVPSHIGVAKFEQDRERQTVFASMQAAPTDELTMTLNVLSSEMDSNNQNQNYLLLPNNDRDAIIANSGVSGGNVLQSSVSGTGDIFIDFINRVSSTETESVDFTVEYETDSYSIHAVAGKTDAKGGTYRETSWEYVNTSADYAFNLSSPNVVTDPLTTDASAFGAGWIWGGEKPTTDEEAFYQFDLDVPVSLGAVTNIKSGVKVRQAERTQSRTVYSWHGPNTLAGNEDLAPGWPVYLQYIFDTCPTLADCGLNGAGNVSVDAPASGSLTNQIEQTRNVMETIAFEGLNGVPADFARSLELANNWAVEEDITAFYVQADFEGDSYRGNFGVRYVDTAQTSSGYAYSTDSWGFKTIDRDWLNPSELAWVSEDNDYSEVLPSFNLAYDLDEDRILRVGAARVMARQNWNQLSPFMSFGSLNQEDPKGEMGNPQLKPMLANQFDASYEWYYTDGALFAATFFHKDVDSYLSSRVVTESRYDEQTMTDVDVDFTQRFNGKGGSTNGIELSWQHSFDNFGVQANYTYTDAESDQMRDAAVPGSGLVEGASEHMYNLTGYYEDDRLSARLMYNYRTEWYKGLHFNGDELWNDTFGQWDMSVSYAVTDNISVVFEGVNLTAEEVVEYNTDKDRVMSLYDNGRRYVLGARMSF